MGLKSLSWVCSVQFLTKSRRDLCGRQTWKDVRKASTGPQPVTFILPQNMTLSIGILMENHDFQAGSRPSDAETLPAAEISCLILFATLTSCDWLCFAAKRHSRCQVSGKEINKGNPVTCYLSGLFLTKVRIIHPHPDPVRQAHDTALPSREREIFVPRSSFCILSLSKNSDLEPS